MTGNMAASGCRARCLALADRTVFLGVWITDPKPGRMALAAACGRVWKTHFRPAFQGVFERSQLLDQQRETAARLAALQNGEL